ncbi:MAG TPA: oxidoreductase, partial [Pseudolysinimonas sp.]|nr:oxidoreductase [Pseudolysinimonas sp.]
AGGAILANVLAQLRYGGTVASCGNAADVAVTTTVLPFILRAVTMTGINSVLTPRALRLAAWARLDRDLDLAVLDGMTRTVGLDDAAAAAGELLAGNGRGRIVVDVHG